MSEIQIVLIALIVLLSLAIILIINLSGQLKKRNKEIEKNLSDLERFQPILDIEAEVERIRRELDQELSIRKNEIETTQEILDEIKSKYQERREVLKRLTEQISLYRDELEFIDFGIYHPIFNFDDSEKYKQAIKDNLTKQKQLIKDKRAAVCNVPWTVDGSKKKGEVMTNRGIRLTLRAFNGECDALIAKVKWNNVNKIEERIRKAEQVLEKLNASNKIYIKEDYLNLKIEQLHLTYELEAKKQQEKEEQRQIREQMREEEIARREIEKAKLEAEKEEARYRKALEKAQKDVEKATGDKLNKLTDQIAQLQEQLRNAQTEKERAISRAQITKSGHVYVISNLGSFGEKVYKIGMTRRLDPMDRVKELGDASVPFRFDVHAIIYSDNAPELESKLHKAFDSKRVNMINNRKEFFKVSLDEIQSVVTDSLDGEIELTKVAEAKEYRETLALLEELENKIHDAEELIENSFPEDLFDD